MWWGSEMWRVFHVFKFQSRHTEVIFIILIHSNSDSTSDTNRIVSGPSSSALSPEWYAALQMTRKIFRAWKMAFNFWSNQFYTTGTFGEHLRAKTYRFGAPNLRQLFTGPSDCSWLLKDVKSSSKRAEFRYHLTNFFPVPITTRMLWKSIDFTASIAPRTTRSLIWKLRARIP
jgi:hypothetical protein